MKNINTIYGENEYLPRVAVGGTCSYYWVLHG